jgi:hypothetical protein
MVMVASSRSTKTVHRVYNLGPENKVVFKATCLFIMHTEQIKEQRLI